MENKLYGNSTCGENWVVFECPIDETETVKIVLSDPHKYGNGNAAETFLDSLYTYPGTAFDRQMIQQGAPQRTLGIVVMVVSFIMLGVALFSTILKVPHSGTIWLFGLMSLFAGAFLCWTHLISASAECHSIQRHRQKPVHYPLPRIYVPAHRKLPAGEARKAGGVIAGSTECHQLRR